jgi:predicted dehydrogenase
LPLQDTRMIRHRIAVVGLGMAVTPHAKSLADLADRAGVVHAMSPSPARRHAFASRFPFPLSTTSMPLSPTAA